MWYFKFTLNLQKCHFAGRSGPPLPCCLLARYLWSQTGWRRNCPAGGEGDASLFNSRFLNYFPNRWLTRFRISVLRRSFRSMLRASSMNCGPKVQVMVIHALPGRSQSCWKGVREREMRRLESQESFIVKVQWKLNTTYQNFAAWFGEKWKYGVEDALFVLGDGAWGGIPVGGAVSPTISHLKQDVLIEKRRRRDFCFNKYSGRCVVEESRIGWNQKCQRRTSVTVNGPIPLLLWGLRRLTGRRYPSQTDFPYGVI